ncbi:MAG: hypothetical protein D8M57_01165 [Candidatus Scalindua sp. AMX11]|nr:MAG: hypothetical protein DWQ00_15145 [Candidatus Scalindua sp.]NOG85001.1 hypothetical protein [Planctomycetota bacterium]RZV93057.1 MAG: hypothetical protein EX341_04095 [Candidatus Scalindua sp. SCAELEC01]TDE66679.1 MAG: hypothetical protein D8M57_01165 [Candidatus Scalindua sp. AMX11]GJQ57984.1 MAG: hypothetical protein SCALA701_07850 [Candidatus Scalindua sp.]
MKLDDITEFSNEKTVSRTLHETQKVKSIFLCMSEGQTDLQDSVNCKVAILVFSGNGSVSTKEGECDVEEQDLIVVERNEARVLKAKTKLTAVVTFIQE